MQEQSKQNYLMRDFAWRVVQGCRGRPAGWLVSAALLFAVPSLAESAELEETIVHGRLGDPLGGAISASQGVVSQHDLALRPLLRTGEVLEAIPGMIVTQHSGTGKANQMFLRGFNLDHGTDFATVVDGMPVNMPTHGHGQGYTDANFLIPELISRIDFKKGPYYADVGDFSSAGGAQLTNLRETVHPFVKLGLGGNGYERLLAVGELNVSEIHNVLGALEVHRYDGPWRDIREGVRRFNGVLTWTPTLSHGDLALTAMGYDARWNSADQIPRRLVQAGDLDELGSVDTTLGGETSRYSLSGTYDAGIGTGTLRAQAYAIRYKLDLFSNFTYFLDDPEHGDQFEQVDERRVFGGNLRYRWGERAQHELGMQVRHDRIDEVGLHRTRAQRRLSSIRDDAVDETAVGVFYQVDFAITPQLRTVLGVRADNYRFEVDALQAANSGKANETQWSPKASLIYAPVENLELYSSLGRGFHSNDARGTTIRVDPVSGDAVERVNALVPSDGAEVGVRWFENDRFNVSATLWWLRIDSELLFVGDAGNTEASRASRRYGFELPAYVRLNEVLTLDVELALAKATFSERQRAEGREIPGAIEKVLAIGLSGEHPSGWYGSARLRYFGERPLIEDGSVESDPSTAVNLLLGWKRGAFDARLEILNLLDSNDDDITYLYASRLPGEADEGVDDQHFHPMEPRTARLHLGWRFE